MRKRSLAAVTITATTVLASALAATNPASAAPSPKVTPRAVPNTKPAWTAHAKHLGHANAKAAVQARVYLAPNGGLAALKQAAAAVSTPGSAKYHHFLTASQYQAKFGVRQASITMVSSYLRSTGLKVTGVSADHRYLSVKGDVAAAQKAFGAHIDKYDHAGRTVQAPASTLTVPADVASSVLTVTGLDTSPKRQSPASKQQAPPPAGSRTGRPCSIYFGQLKAKYEADYQTPLPAFKGTTLSYAPCGYTGPQFRAAYEGNTSLDGSGVRVAILDAYAAPTIKSDANTYAKAHGDGAYAKGQFTQSTAAKFTHQADCGPSGWYGEETLDVEAVHAMAPSAGIHYYGAASCYDADFIDALGQIVDDADVSLVTNSWDGVEEGEDTDSINAYESIFLQGALEGISFMFSSGDNGDELASTGIKQADYPASDPYVTAVGGTSTAIGSNGNLEFEAGWGTHAYTLSDNAKKWQNQGYLYGAGGGTSALFTQPDYQAGVTSSGARQVPDVAMDADPSTGMLVGETQTFPSGVAYGEYRIGGTSLASPLFAGMTALSLQHAGSPAGLLNPTIYANAGSGAFTDVTGSFPQVGVVRPDYVNGLDPSGGMKYAVRTFGQDSSLKVTKGYDEVTGVGSPNAGWLTAISGS